MFFTADQLIAHAFGDYVLQSDWMAGEKTHRSMACAAHVACYVLPFLFLTRDPRALVFIAGTHFVIDRWRLARYVVWAKNFLAPRRRLAEPRLTAENRLRRNFAAADMGPTGYGIPALSSLPGEVSAPPVWMSTWLMIIADNLMHVTLNAAALHWWG